MRAATYEQGLAMLRPKDSVIGAASGAPQLAGTRPQTATPSPRKALLRAAPARAERSGLVEILGPAPQVGLAEQYMEMDPVEIMAAHVNLGGAGRDPYDMIQNYVENIGMGLATMLAGYSAAVEQFQTAVTLEVLEKQSGGVLETLARAIFSELFAPAAKVLSALPSLAQAVWNIVRGLDGAIASQGPLAAQSPTLFTLNLRRRIVPAFQAPIVRTLRFGRRALEQRFESLGSADGATPWKPGQRQVNGAQADMLKRLVREGDAFLTRAPGMDRFTQKIAERWVTANRGALESDFLAGATRQGYIHVLFDLSDEGHSVGPGKARLLCPGSTGTSRLLMRSIPGFSVDKVQVPKTVQIRYTGRFDLRDPERSALVHLDATNAVVDARDPEGRWPQVRPHLAGIQTLEG